MQLASNPGTRGQRCPGVKASEVPPPDHIATSIPIPFYPSTLDPLTPQQRPPPPPAPLAPPPPAPAQLPSLPTPTRSRHIQVKVQQRFALPAELRAVLQCMPQPKKPRLTASVGRSVSGGENRGGGGGGDRKRRRPPSPSAAHQDVGHLEDAMTRISVSLHEIQQELRGQHYPYPARSVPVTVDTATAPSYKVLSSAHNATVASPSNRAMNRDTSSNDGRKSNCSRTDGPRFTVRNADGTEVVLDGGVDGRMVEILVGDFATCLAGQKETALPARTSSPSLLPAVVTCATARQDACTSPLALSVPIADEKVAGSVASSIWIQHQSSFQQQCDSPTFSQCSAFMQASRARTYERDHESSDDALDFSVERPTKVSPASLPLKWPAPAASSPSSLSSHCFSSRESSFSPYASEHIDAEEGMEELKKQHGQRQERTCSRDDSRHSPHTSTRAYSRCESSCCECLSFVGDDGGYDTDSSSSSSISSSSFCSSSSISSSSSFSSSCSSSSPSTSQCCRSAHKSKSAYIATNTLGDCDRPVRLLRW